MPRVATRNNVTEHGSPTGQPLLFAHGFGCDQNMWRYVWPAFADEHRIVLWRSASSSRVACRAASSCCSTRPATART